MAHLPLYLSGDAFSVWSEMCASDQGDEEKVKECLQKSFYMLPGEAYSQFGRHKKHADETADAYLSDLRRLLRFLVMKWRTVGRTQCYLNNFWSVSPCNMLAN